MDSQQLEKWADRLLDEYEEGRKDLGDMNKNLSDDVLADRQDKTQLNSMIASMTYSIDWLKIGRQPDLRRGAYRRNAYGVSMYDDMDILPDINEQLKKEREPLYMSQEQKEKLIELLRSFSDRERQCFIMHKAEGLSMQKIADKLDISKGAVQVYIKRASDKVDEVI